MNVLLHLPDTEQPCTRGRDGAQPLAIDSDVILIYGKIWEKQLLGASEAGLLCSSRDGRLVGQQEVWESQWGVSEESLPESGQGRPQLCSPSAFPEAKPVGVAASKQQPASRP